MPSVEFPVELQNVPLPVEGKSISVASEIERIDVLKARDEYILTALSQFNAVPLGTIIMTSIAYASDDDLPEGWIFADGATYSKETYPNLWSEVAKNESNYISSTTWNTAVDQSIYDGKYVDFGDSFKVPKLNDVFIRTTTDPDETGSYLSDQVGPHKHAITTYPLNAIDTSVGLDEYGVALTNKVDSVGTVPTEYNTHVAEYDTESGKDADETTVTRPKSISFLFLIKATFSNLLSSEELKTSADLLQGHAPSVTAEPSSIPCSDDEGHIDVNYLDPDALVEHIKDSLINSGILDSAYVRQDETATVADPDKVVRADNGGVVDSDWLNYTPTEDIDSLFNGN